MLKKWLKGLRREKEQEWKKGTFIIPSNTEKKSLR
jgi:hypothetical protein